MDINFLSGNPVNLLTRKKELSTVQYLLVFIVSAVFFFGLAVLIVEFDQGDMIRNGEIERSFYKDYNYMAYLLITIPGLILLSIKLKWLIPNSITKLRDQGILIVKSNYSELVRKWNKKIKRNNTIAIIVACLFLGLTFPITINDISSDSIVSFQTRGTGEFVLPGYWFLFATLVLALMVALVLILIVHEILFLRKLVKEHSDIQIQVLHPDRLGGLRPITQIGFANQAVLAVLGINISAMVYTWFFIGASGETSTLIGYAIFLGAAYVVLAPLFFLAPLVLFRQNILRIKSITLNKISSQYNNLIKEMLKPDDISVSSEEIENLNSIKYLYSEVDKLPEWPFDWGTMKNFTLTLVSPLVPMAITWIFDLVLSNM
ncbi:MAG: hypothetical protein JXN65_10220 [Clostridia bacterium]|nr:hypothetical protein [Clostridia bacterium]